MRTLGQMCFVIFVRKISDYLMDEEWASVLEYDANDFIIGGGGMAVKLDYLQECKNYKCLLGNWQPFSE